MHIVGPGFFEARLDKRGRYELVFADGAGKWYPGEFGNNFLAANGEIFVRDGILTAHDPRSSRPQNVLMVLTLNLHTYQEANPTLQIERVAEFIARTEPDLICLQECGQSVDAPPVQDERACFNDGRSPDVLRSDNMALLLAARLEQNHSKRLYYAWAMSHIGFDVYEEGVAIMSPHVLSGCEARYVSQTQGKWDLNSRRAICGFIEPDGIGRVSVVSVHTSWWSADPVQQNAVKDQIDSLKELVHQRQHDALPVASIVAGDFNSAAGGQGYKRLTDGTTVQFVDTYVEANPHGFNVPTEETGTRIDYIFRGGNDRCVATTSQVFFNHTPSLGGRVSDHFAVVSYLRFPSLGSAEGASSRLLEVGPQKP
jgi:maltose 6'-phosphate phosphatase